ncbi:zinc resistance-associated protein [Desulfovibrio ferrophilus]|uniref:Zinc resistance-associated protein n=2 Tax=Desulfovibrio ferrophilus TaxID=241368 RepID=A0A2Z6B0D4_9BACT|nr:zinc resistance-associated protein [Desulfovibrio ferrophilus]
MNRKTLSIVIATVAVLSLSAMAFAYGPGMGPGNGRGGCGGYGPAQTLTPEQQEKLDILQKEYFSKTQSLRQEVYAKHMELEALLAAKDADAAKVDEVTKRLVDLKGRMFEQRVEFRKQLKELGIQNYGRGGRGGCGQAKGNCPGYGQRSGPQDGSGPCGGAPNCPGANG